MRRGILCGLCLLTLGAAVGSGVARSAAAPSAHEPGVSETIQAMGGNVRRTETDHFVVLSDSGSEWSRQTALLLEPTHDQFERFMKRLGIDPVPPQSKLLCVLIEDHDRFQAFATAQDGVRARWMGGYYATQSNRVVFFDSRTAPEFEQASRDLAGAEQEAVRAKRGAPTSAARRAITAAIKEAAATEKSRLEEHASSASISKTTHEAAHLLSFNRGLQSRAKQYPFWLSEGLATCFEASSAADVRKGRFGPEYVNRPREAELASALAEERLIPLEAFVEFVAAPTHDEHAARVMYAQAYGLFRWLHRYEPEALAGLFLDIANHPEAMISPKQQGELFRARFGDPAKLERTWLRELRAASPRIAGAPIEE